MEFGEKLKQARLDAGLSQRQLCGDTITRNMLSQIENGAAKPSFATLQILASRLGKPVSYFWEQAPSENLNLLRSAAKATPEQALAILKDYLLPDPTLDEGYYLLSCRCCMDLAQQALAENRIAYARTLLEQAVQYGAKTSAYPQLLRPRLTVLRFLAGETDVCKLAAQLPDNTEEMLLRASAALSIGDAEKCLTLLAATDRQTEQCLLLKGDAHIALEQFEQAILCLKSLENPKEIYPRLELCYRELGDYKKAYEYACMQR